MATSNLPKVVLVTGSSAGGIGGALCEEYARAGCIVYASARRLESMDALAPLGDIRKIRLDVNDAQSIEDVVKAIIGAEGRIDILVNNAGVLAIGPILDVSLDEVESAFKTNVFSILKLIQAIVPHMASKPSSVKSKGLVINIGSTTAVFPLPWGGIYASTKGALRSISETLYMELQPLGVHVMLVEPGGIKSNLADNYAPRYSQPSTSLYRDYLPRILARIQISQTPGAMDTNEFARAVVKASNLPPMHSSSNRVTQWKPKFYLSIGNNAWTLWFLSWLPMTTSLGIVWNAMGKLKKK